MYKCKVYQGHPIAYREVGSGEQTILFLHGMGSSSLGWEDTIQALKEDYRCIAVDLPGFGMTPWIETQDLFGLYLNLISDLVTDLIGSSLIVAGHSMGGQLAMLSALDMPHQVSGVILSAPAGLEPYSVEDRRLTEQFFSLSQVMQWDEEEVKGHFLRNFYEMPSWAEPLLQQRLEKLTGERHEGFCKAVAAAVSGMLDYPLPNKTVDIPMTVIFGQQDQYIPNRVLHPELTVDKVASSIKQLTNNYSIHLLEDCGHFPHVEQRTKCLSIIRSIVEQYFQTTSMPVNIDG
ncbi:alpha/beta hydrolase [Algivirga pacifica]|uniref:Alpha/beta fold hydrolase n=1 Tax=Algivirga pacifica TaxID=1162670 RepID=A0ABP9DG05_9BACT